MFFAARGTSPQAILFWLLCVTFVIPVFLTALLAIAKRVSAPIGKTLFYSVLTTLVALIATPILSRLGILSDPMVIVCAICIAICFLVAYLRFDPVRQLLGFMVVGVVAFPLLFIFHPDLRPLIFKPTQTSQVSQVSGSTSENMPSNVVLVLFDELPLFSLLEPGGSINKHRYPNFAKLAATSTWYRNASTVAEFTQEAVMSLLTGKLAPETQTMPVFTNFPENLFSLLGHTHKVNASEGLGKMCPEYLCEKSDGGEVDGMLSLLVDSFYVYAHIVVPASYAKNFPAIDQNWESFAANRGDFFQASNPAFAKMIAKVTKQHLDKPDFLAPFSKFVAAIEKSDKPRLDYLHIVFPHVPFRYLPSGKTYNGSHFKPRDGLVELQWQAWWPAKQGQQRALLQLALVDSYLGKLLTRLETTGLLDETLIIVTSDHGASYRANQKGRHVTQENYMDILPVPLFIKVPGQKTATVDDSNVEIIDILPTITDFLNIPMPYEADGHSLLDGERPVRERKQVRLRFKRTIEFFPAEFELSGVRAMTDTFGLLPDELYSHGPEAQLIGRDIDSFESAASPSLRLNLEVDENIASIDLNDSFLPTRIFGYLQQGNELPITRDIPLAVVVNGRIVTTVWSYRDGDQTVFSAMLPEHALAEGRNQVDVYAVENVDGAVKMIRFPKDG